MLIYLAQLTHEANTTIQNKCFPLAVGFIAAYLKKHFGDEIEVELFKRPTELNAAIKSREPDILMLSNYMWNENLTCCFANRTKEVYPDVFVVLGGPNFSLIPEVNFEFLRKNLGVDMLVHYEGEITARKIVGKYLEVGSIDLVKRLNIPSTNSIIGTEMFSGDSGIEAERETRIGLPGSGTVLDEIPSPYISGLFDKFFADGEVPLVETNRGCPFSCTYCQQGTEYFNKVRHFSTTRVIEEMRYIAKKVKEDRLEMYSLEIADPNFAMYNSDAEIVDSIRKLQDEFGFPKNIGCSTGKNRAEVIIENTFKLQEGTILLRSAMQSTNPSTLEAIRRQNIKLDTYREIQKEMDRRKLENNADLMLGLPNETLDSHLMAIEDLVDVGIKEIACLQTIILKGTPMERREYTEKFGIATKCRVIPECYGDYDILGQEHTICEVEWIINKTSSMSMEDYKACRKMHLLVMIYHNTRLLSFVYTVLDHIGICKSKVLRHLYDLEDPQLEELVNDFLADTEHELFDTFEQAAAQAHVVEVTANKIFRHLSIALFKRQDVVVKALNKVLGKLLGQDKADMVEDLMCVFDASIISPFRPTSDMTIELKSTLLVEKFGSSINLSLSPDQASILTMLNKVYTTPEDKVNKLAYHLRPGNLAMKVNSILWDGRVLSY